MDLRILLLYVTLLWSTLARAAAPDCQFHVTNPNGEVEVYDFSSLKTNIPWEIPDASESKGKNGVIFLSMCGPLQGLTPSQCPDTSASVCLTRRGENEKWKTVISNAGANKTKLWYKDRQLILSLKGDKFCKGGKNFSTDIHFHCNPQTIGEPWYTGLYDECVVEVGWITAAACPVTPEHDICLLPVPGGRPLDLTTLSSPTYYTVTEPGGKVFQLNLCREIKDGVCNQGATACLVNTTTTLGKLDVGSELAHIPKGLKLKYYEGGGLSTDIEFTCNLTAPLKAEPKYVAQNGNTTVFQVDTPFACPASPIDCVAYDNAGVKYDLNPLRRDRDIWTVRDNRRGKNNILYHISICGPLPSGVTSACLAGNVGACVINSKPQANTKNDSNSFSLGLVEHPPKVTKDGTLLLEYKGGSPCKQSKFRRRISIALECSTKEQGPVLDAVHEDCSYAFLWRTPAACPSKPAQGENCKVTDPRFGYSFDVRPLYNNQADHQLQGDNNDSFRVNLCGSLHTPCNGMDNVSVCLKRSGKEIAIGHRDDKLLYQDGRLSLKLHGDECQPGINSSVTIILSCEHLIPDQPLPTPQVFPSGQNDCQFFMIWNTPNSCPPYHEISCSTTDKNGQVYDLTELSWRSNNHEARGQDGRRSGLQLNVCRSVIFGRDSECEPHSGACLSVGGKFLNVGDVSEGPFVENGVLKLRYTMGAICPNPDGNDHMSTTITFICNPDAVDAEPQYIGEHQCEHQVLWITAEACPKTFDTTPASNSCSVLNPVTKFRYDLSSLMNKEFTTMNEAGDIYTIGVCTALKNSPCGTGTGSCMTQDNSTRNSGIANNNLQFRSNGILYLSYVGGETCGQGGQRGTLIKFMCGAEGSLQGPRVVDVLGECLTILHWPLELACERRMRCVTNYLDQEFDLSPLIRISQNYQVLSKDGREFFINVCRPVIPVEGLSCSAGSAACVARRRNRTYVEELSLGFPAVQPVVTSNSGASLMYIHGSPCPYDRGINISSKINFRCDKTIGTGYPTFISETHDCQYQFDWLTSLVCGDTEEKIGNCTVYSEQLKRFISLESLQKPGGYKAQNNQSQTIYLLNLCGEPSICQGAPVCHRSSIDWASHGSLQRALYDYRNDYLKLQYSAGSPCARNDKYGAEIWLHCDAKAGLGNPRVIMEDSCIVIFEWRSSAVCVGKQRTTTAKPAIPAPSSVSTVAPSGVVAEGTSESSEGPSAGAIVAILLGIAASIVLGVLLGLYVYRGGRLCGPNWRLSRWIHSPSHAQVHYSRETLSSAFDH